jgi:putative tryptophan/tyrosine transport system substrate-binding protein
MREGNRQWALGNSISEKTVRKKTFCFALGALLSALSFPVMAQEPAKIPKIGFLASGAASGSSSIFRSEVFRQQLRELGYVEGKNIAFESRYGEDNFDRLPALADELVRLKVDVLVINTTPAALAAKNATRTIPIVSWRV